MTHILTTSIPNVMKKGEFYGNAGDKVKIIAVHGNTLIVEGGNGNRYPVRVENVTMAQQTNLFQ